MSRAQRQTLSRLNSRWWSTGGGRKVSRVDPNWLNGFSQKDAIFRFHHVSMADNYVKLIEVLTKCTVVISV
jgi:hypothetical protein